MLGRFRQSLYKIDFNRVGASKDYINEVWPLIHLNAPVRVIRSYFVTRKSFIIINVRPYPAMGSSHGAFLHRRNYATKPLLMSAHNLEC